MKKNKKINSKIIVVCLIQLLLFVFSLNIFVKIDQKETYEYSVSAVKYSTDIVECNGSQNYTIEFDSRNILNYSFSVIGSSWKDGLLNCKLLDNKQKIIFENNYSSDSIYSGTIVLDLSNVIIDADKKYTLEVKNNGSGVIGITVDEDHNLKSVQKISFGHKTLFKNLIILINVILLMLQIYLIRSNNSNRKFLISSLVVGIILCAVIPPYTAPDELRHFARAYDISKGNILCSTYVAKEEFNNQIFNVCELPKELYDLKLISQSNSYNYASETNTSINFDVYLEKIGIGFSGKTVTVPIPGTYNITTLAYLPQVIGILLGKLLGFSPILVFLFSRIMNLLCALLVSYKAIKILPDYKKIYMVLYAIPSVSFFRCTSSYDGVLYAIVFLLLAYIIKIKNNNEKVYEKKNLIPILVMVCLIALIKLPYCLIIFAMLIVDEKQFVLDKKSFKMSKVLFCLGAIVLGVICFFIDKKILSLEAYNESIANILGSNLSYALHNPFQTINTLSQTFFVESFSLFLNGIIFIDALFLAIVYFVWCAVVSRKSIHKDILNAFDKKCFTILALGIWLLIICNFYFRCSDASTNTIWGLQGRYICTVLPLIILAFSKKEKQNSISCSTVCLGNIVISFIFILQIILKYWI